MHRSKILILVLFIISGFTYADVKNYAFDPLHTSVSWQISHFGFSHPSGKWMVESGAIMLDEDHLTNSRVTATIQIDELATGIPKLDEHLISNQFFDAASFPVATFVSTRVKQKSSGKLIVMGNLTLHGITKPVTLNVTVNKIGMHPITMHKTAGFSATATIKRSDFGMKAYLPGLGDDVNLFIETEAGLVSESAAK